MAALSSRGDLELGRGSRKAGASWGFRGEAPLEGGRPPHMRGHTNAPMSKRGQQKEGALRRDAGLPWGLPGCRDPGPGKSRDPRTSPCGWD